MSLVIELIPLDQEIVRSRLAGSDFRLTRPVGGGDVEVHFGPEFPGDGLVLYPRFLAGWGAWTIEGTYLVVEAAEAIGQLGTIGPPAGEVEIGYGINPSARGRGVATAAVAELLRLLGGRPGIDRIVARTAIDNPASGRVLAKNGFRVAGRVRDGGEELLLWHSA